jgi:60S ribosome subunit biogenesis protein NIP7
VHPISIHKMRPLTEDETKTLFIKLSEYIGKSIERLINRSDERHCFRLIKDRVYYVSESLMKASTSIARDDLLHVGVCLGKFSKTGKFRLAITALEYLSQYAKYKVWVKPSAEMSFLYGNHVTKNGLARMTEATPQYAGVVVYNMNDIPLGFGVAAQSTEHCQTLDPTGNVVLHQADIGDYLRGVEDDMF